MDIAKELSVKGKILINECDRHIIFGKVRGKRIDLFKTKPKKDVSVFVIGEDSEPLYIGEFKIKKSEGI